MEQTSTEPTSTEPTNHSETTVTALQAQLDTQRAAYLAEGHVSAEVRIDRLERAVSLLQTCLLYTSPSPRDQRGSRMPSSA